MSFEQPFFDVPRSSSGARGEMNDAASRRGPTTWQGALKFRVPSAGTRFSNQRRKHLETHPGFPKHYHVVSKIIKTKLERFF